MCQPIGKGLEAFMTMKEFYEKAGEIDEKTAQKLASSVDNNLQVQIFKIPKKEIGSCREQTRAFITSAKARRDKEYPEHRFFGALAFAPIDKRKLTEDTFWSSDYGKFMEFWGEDIYSSFHNCIFAFADDKEFDGDLYLGILFATKELIKLEKKHLIIR